MKKLSILALASLAIFTTVTFSSRATDFYVGVSFFDLSPNPVNIKVGDVVYWTEADPDFGPYIVSGPWGDDIVPYGIQFLSAGSYQYTAQSVFGGSWGGTVNVSANSLPTVSITNPTNNSVFMAPATFSFTADASDPDPNDISDVEFWAGTNMVDDVFSPPYSTTVTNLAAGIYTLKAIVWDYSNATATNSVTVTVVNPGPITLTASALVGSNLIFRADGLIAGKTNVLQSSSNLVNWLPVRTNVSSGASMNFTNPPAGRRQFYRLMQIN